MQKFELKKSRKSVAYESSADEREVTDQMAPHEYLAHVAHKNWAYAVPTVTSYRKTMTFFGQEPVGFPEYPKRGAAAKTPSEVSSYCAVRKKRKWVALVCFYFVSSTSVLRRGDLVDPSALGPGIDLVASFLNRRR